MTNEIQFGPVIAVDGLPDWVDRDEVIMGKWHNTWFDGGTWAHCYSSPGTINAIRLRADHPYYLKNARQKLQTAEEFEAENGIHPDKLDWTPVADFSKPSEMGDGDYVRVKRMTVSEYQRDDNGSLSWARRVGIIREETPLEQFGRDHGGLDNNQRDIVEAFIAWQNANG